MKVIIECGHGGMIDGKYQCLVNGKQYTFKYDNFTVYEGVVNRQIAARLIEKLKSAGIPYIDYNSTNQEDIPLARRTAQINKLCENEKDLWLLSIHSNAMGVDMIGNGNSANGYEVYSAINGSKKSQMISLIAEKQYKADGYKWRGAKTANYWILRQTNCPAILVENGFFTNRRDADFITSEKGQDKIAETLFKIVKQVA